LTLLHTLLSCCTLPRFVRYTIGLPESPSGFKNVNE
jgi:hypothetical protein